MIRVLFICLGNICRSPMSEAYMRHVINQSGLSNEIEVISKATSNYNLGDPPHAGTQKILKRHNIDFSNIFSEKLTKDDLLECDYIIVMDDSNMKDVMRMNPNKKIYKLTDFIEGSTHKFVPDPYYTGDFDLTYELVQSGCDALLKQIIKENNL